MCMVLAGVFFSTAFTACKRSQPADPCSGVDCCGHGSCSVVGGEAVCECEAGWVKSGDGRHCVPAEGPCAGQECSGKGCCVETPMGAECFCDAGYMPDPSDPAALSCVEARCLGIGERCNDSSQCCEGDCLKYTGKDWGYCTRRNCAQDADCENVSGDGRQMCCVDTGGEAFLCMKLGRGCQCGDQSGTCGASCACQNDSACAPGYSCIRSSDDDQTAVCTRRCVTDSDCRECRSDTDPLQTFTCQPIFGGETYCLPAKQNLCSWSGDCPANEVCVAYPTADGNGLEGRCNRVGALDTGSECDSDQDPNLLPFERKCAGFYCMHDKCSAVCRSDADCPEGMFCGYARFNLGGAGNRMASINMCQGGKLCSSSFDCTDGDVCMVTHLSDYELGGVCDTYDGSLPIGAECNDDASPADLPRSERCIGYHCLYGHCSQVCARDSHCGESGRCCQVRFGGMGPTGEDTAMVPMCRWVSGSGQQCRGNKDCPAHETCQYCVGPDRSVSKFCVAENCDPAVDENCALPGTTGCAEEDGPTCWGDLCLVGLGGSFCSSLCDTNFDCPEGMTCGRLSVADNQTTGACL
ncbi:MAG: hypothetical protein D6806_04115 [Deltaproteobacteria bacterium]|nr:MAG: hypothetical protein D6806_04115 [Deltaproteobacteria bacterium]